MSYERPGAGAPEETPCRYGGSRLLFRGPKHPRNRPYLACLGGSETYGRFVDQPFAALLEQALGQPCLNLGCINAGLDAFLGEPGVVDIAARSRAVVVQLFGAQNLSNPFYRVHPRRNDRFLAPSDRLTALYPEVDFTEIHFTRHLLSVLHRTDPGRFAEVSDVLRRTWLARTDALLRRLGPRSVLLWLRFPGDGGGPAGRRLGPEPLLVDRPLIAALNRQPVVEVPVTPAGRCCDLEVMRFAPMQRPAAEQALGPGAHHDIAARLMRALRTLA